MAGKTILAIISMALLWQGGGGFGIAGMDFLIIHMTPMGVRVTLIFFGIINNSSTKDFTLKKKTDLK